ncbi:hypothetical protein RI054_11g55780 [Pseudoscourfieldia marina]
MASPSRASRGRRPASGGLGLDDITSIMALACTCSSGGLLGALAPSEATILSQLVASLDAVSSSFHSLERAILESGGSMPMHRAMKKSRTASKTSLLASSLSLQDKTIGGRACDDLPGDITAIGMMMSSENDAAGAHKNSSTHSASMQAMRSSAVNNAQLVESEEDAHVELTQNLLATLDTHFAAPPFHHSADIPALRYARERPFHPQRLWDLVLGASTAATAWDGAAEPLSEWDVVLADDATEKAGPSDAAPPTNTKQASLGEHEAFGWFELATRPGTKWRWCAARANGRCCVHVSPCSQASQPPIGITSSCDPSKQRHLPKQMVVLRSLAGWTTQQVEAALDACLLTDEEFAAGAAAWQRRMPHPWLLLERAVAEADAAGGGSGAGTGGAGGTPPPLSPPRPQRNNGSTTPATDNNAPSEATESAPSTNTQTSDATDHSSIVLRACRYRARRVAPSRHRQLRRRKVELEKSLLYAATEMTEREKDMARKELNEVLAELRKESGRLNNDNN